MKGRFQPRRITNNKFKNVSSQQAMNELKQRDIGDFIFRPSSKGQNNLTLTWLFYTNCFVHIDIVEKEKPIGASIGNKLEIGSEHFDKLDEIIERYFKQFIFKIGTSSPATGLSKKLWNIPSSFPVNHLKNLKRN